MASTGEVWKLGHRPALDGVRGIAVLLVLLNHAGLPWSVSAGTVGVTAFFVLSGFLITSLLLEEHASNRTVDLGAFWLRRVRRLLPALVAYLAVVVALVAVGVPLLGGVEELLPALLYYQNWTMAAGAEDTVVTHTWSLAIEEQFYLVWPLLLLALAGRLPRSVLVALATAGVVAAAASSLGMTAARVYYGSDARAGALLAGCALASGLHGARSFRSRPWMGALAMVGLCLVGAGSNVVWKYLAAPQVAALLTVVAITAVVGAGSGDWLTNPWLCLVGKRSYALYLWNPLAFALLTVDGPMHWPSVVAAVVASWVAALLSWRYVEQPALQVRARPLPETALSGSGRGPCAAG